jgi:hypothetical protein
VLLKALAVWLAQLVAIVVLGGLRNALLLPLIGEHRAHQLGTVAACVAVFVIICLSLPWVAPVSRAQALALGAFWLALAVAFEFGVFHFIVGVPWSELLADYNLLDGRLLVLLWLTVLFGPLLCFVLRRRP